MRFLIFILSCIIFFALCGCKKDFSVPEISKKIEGVSDDTEIYDDEANTVEINETEVDDTPRYNAESGPVVTKIISINGLRVGSSQGFDDCGKYKYPNSYILDTTETTLTIILSRPDTVRTILDGSNFFGDGIEIIKFDQVGSTTLRLKIKALKDTMQTKTVDFGIISGIPLSRSNPNSPFPTMKGKIKCVGYLKDAAGQKFLYSQNRWMELYWARKNNRTLSTPSPILIDSTWIPKRGDVLLWSDRHTGTIFTTPTSVLRNRTRTEGGAQYRQNRFYLSEMNVRCKGEKTVKFIWHKSFDKNTLRGANKSRGHANFYYRYQ